MKNPWKKLSKINPQPEDGTRRINYKVFEALIKAKLPTAEMSVTLAIISKTWGYNKKSDAISISQLSDITGFYPRHVQKVIRILDKKRILVISVSERVSRGTPLNEYLFNKHYDTWKIQDKKRVSPRTGGVIQGQKRVSPRTPTIETITIEKDILSYILCDNSEDVLNFAKDFISFISSTKTKFAPNAKDLLQTSCDSVDKLIRLDGFDLDYIRSVLLWAVKDSFWENNVLSLSGLRKKSDGLTKFQKIASAFEKDKKKPINKKLNGRSAENAAACSSFINSMMQEPDYEE